MVKFWVTQMYGRLPKKYDGIIVIKRRETGISFIWDACSMCICWFLVAQMYDVLITERFKGLDCLL